MPSRARTTKNVIAEELHVGTEATFAGVAREPATLPAVMRRDF